MNRVALRRKPLDRSRPDLAVVTTQKPAFTVKAPAACDLGVVKVVLLAVHKLLLFVLVATLPIARPLPLSLAYLLLLLLWLQGPWQSVAHDVWDGLLLVGCVAASIAALVLTRMERAVSAGDLILLLESVVLLVVALRSQPGVVATARKMRRSRAPPSAAAAAAAAAPAVAHARRKSSLVAWYDRARGRIDAKDGAANTRRTHARAARGGKGQWRITLVLLALASLVLPCAIGLPTLAGAAFALLHWGLGGSTVTARTRHRAARLIQAFTALWLFVLYAEQLLQAHAARPPARPPALAAARPPALPAALSPAL